MITGANLIPRTVAPCTYVQYSCCMLITHRIALDPTNKQATLLRQHAGYARFAWNWAVAECRRALDAGGMSRHCIKVMNQESLSPEQEMVQDMLSIVHCFSARLYGLRNYRKSLRQALESDTQS